MTGGRCATERRRVVYWGSQPSPYVVERLNAVASSGKVDLMVWFDYEREPDRSWHVDPGDWLFRARFLSEDGRVRVPLSELLEARADLLVCRYDRKHTALGILMARGLVGRVTLRCLPAAKVQSGRRTVIHRLARRAVFRIVDGAKVAGPDGVVFAERQGLPRDRSWSVTQSVDLLRFGKAARLTEEQRANLKKRFGARGCTFLYAGRLVKEKGLYDVLAAYEQMRTSETDVSLLLVGDGRDEAQLRSRAAGVTGVVFAGFLQPDDLPAAYGAADVFVFPTHGDPHGQVVQEAMAAGLPVIATTAAFDVRQRIEDGHSGFIIPPGDSVTLADRMTVLAKDSALRTKMAEAALARSAAFSHAAYADDFEKFVGGVLALPPRRTPEAQLAAFLAWIVRAICLVRPVGPRAAEAREG